MLYFILGIVVIYVIVNFKFRFLKKKKLSSKIYYSNFTRQHMFNNQDDYQTLNQQQLVQDMHMRQVETARLMATGNEFGGFNPDINLNPGQAMQQQMMNNFGGPGMF